MKTVVITGIGKGIGKALAEKFLTEGHFVIGTSTSGTVAFTHENLLVVGLNITHTESIDACIAEITKTGKTIDILINNAGVALDIDTNTIAIETLRATLEVNLIGTIDFTEKILPLLAPQAHILNTASSAGSLARTQEADDDMYPAYRISKAALNMYTRILAVRLRDRATVSSFHPGWVKTDMGGPNADMTPTEAAEYIYTLAMRSVETGQFWFKGEKFEW